MPKFLLTTKTIKNEKKSFTEVVASAPEVDRMGDVVLQDWRLDNFKSNPVILYNHNPDLVVGKAVDIKVEKGKLLAKIEWDEGDHNELGTRVARQFDKGFLNAVSVGFKTMGRKYRNELDKKDPHYSKEGGSVLGPNELLEISAVSIPALPTALAKRGFMDKEDVYKEIKNLILVYRELTDEEDEDLKEFEEEEEEKELEESEEEEKELDSEMLEMVLEALRSDEARAVIESVVFSISDALEEGEKSFNFDSILSDDSLESFFKGGF